MSLVRTMRSAKKEVLRLLILFIDTSGPPETEPQQVAQGFIPPVLDPILGDFQRNIAGARDPEVLSLFTCVDCSGEIEKSCCIGSMYHVLWRPYLY